MNYRREEIEADVLVVGGALAGLMAAIEAARTAGRVVLVTKGRAARSGNTIMSRNGMAAVMEEGFDGDSVQLHVEDTLAAGCYLNNTAMVGVFAGEARVAIQRLMEAGVKFLTASGQLLRKGSPGHSRKRFLTVDSSFIRSPRTKGMALTLPLAREAARRGVHFIEGVTVAGLAVDDGKIGGAWGLDRQENKAWVFKAPAVILACGGAGRLYPVTTNTGDVTGDGYGLARLAGAELRDMEFVQFHPAVALGRPRLVMSTSPFADGAVLRNRSGERFMARYSAQLEMATRDVMARAIFEEIKAGRGTGGGGVYIDFSSIPEDVMRARYEDLCAYLGGRRVVEVAPAMHFMMGGIAVDETGRTGIKGLFAAGEAAGGLHGANRLAGNALTEAAVFGMITGREAACEAMAGGKQPKFPAGDFLPVPCSQAGREEVRVLRSSLKKIMGRELALVRRKKGLKKAVEVIAGLQARLAKVMVRNWHDLVECCELRLSLAAAAAIAEAALARRESLGAHYREDG